jgi:hypothetical protein
VGTLQGGANVLNEAQNMLLGIPNAIIAAHDYLTNDTWQQLGSQWSQNLVVPNDPGYSVSMGLAGAGLTGLSLGTSSIPGMVGYVGNAGNLVDAGTAAAESTVTSGGAADAFQYQSLKAGLANQQAAGEAASAFNESGGLSQSAIDGSRPIIQPEQLGNPNIPKGFSKYATGTYNSPSRPFQVHFYRNPTTGEIYYGLDYKAVFNAPGGN